MNTKWLNIPRQPRKEEGVDDSLGTPPLEAAIAPGTSGSAPAAFGRRLIATLIDGLIIGVLLAPVSFIAVWLLGIGAAELAGGDGLRPFLLLQGVVLLARLVLSFFYFGWFYKNKGATPGKIRMKLKVLDSRTGEYLGYGNAFLRETVGKLISGVPFLLGFWIVLFREDRKAFHDLIFNTQVVYQEDPPEPVK